MSTKEPWKFPTALTFSNPLPYSVPERVKSISQPSSNCRQSKRRDKKREYQMVDHVVDVADEYPTEVDNFIELLTDAKSYVDADEQAVLDGYISSLNAALA